MTDDKNIDVNNRGIIKSEIKNKTVQAKKVTKITLRHTNGVKSSAPSLFSDAVLARSTCPTLLGKYQIVSAIRTDIESLLSQR